MLDILNKTSKKPPLGGLLISKVVKNILGKDYTLSLVFASESFSKELNKKYRQKHHPANILSFPLSQNSGEIVMSPSQIKKEAKQYAIAYRSFTLFILVHGLLHLAGLKHGKIMSQKEKLWLRNFKVPITERLATFL